MSNIDKRALREAAEKATPGVWVYLSKNTSIEYDYGSDDSQGSITYMDSGDFTQKQTDLNGAFISAANPTTVLALLDELEAEQRISSTWRKAALSNREKLEAAEKRVAELPGQKRLIGWRMADYTDETADPALAKNWATAVDVLPIFEGDVNTKLSTAAAGKGEAS